MNVPVSRWVHQYSSIQLTLSALQLTRKVTTYGVALPVQEETHSRALKAKRGVLDIVHTCMIQRTNTFRTPHRFLYASIADLIRQAKAHTTMHCAQIFWHVFKTKFLFFLVFNYLDSTRHKTGLLGFGGNFFHPKAKNFHPSLHRGMHALTNFNHNLAKGMPESHQDWLAIQF